MKTIDPEGVSMRTAHRLKRRKYRAKGPIIYVWHVDGYGKLKPYGFCIHGSIDGYSRRILWLEVSQSNNPRYIAMYYLEAIRRLGLLQDFFVVTTGQKNILFLFSSRFSGTTTQIVWLV